MFNSCKSNLIRLCLQARNFSAGKQTSRILSSIREVPLASCNYSYSRQYFQSALYFSRLNRKENCVSYGFTWQQCFLRLYSTDPQKGLKEAAKEKSSEIVDESKLTTFQKFKKMYKEYWYVVIPVHGVTSAVWFGSFFYAAKCGVDIVPLLEWMNVPERFITTLKGSVGHAAVAYAMYKVATPLRYGVTLGGTTISINYLKRLGYIKPVPSAKRFKEMYDEKKIALRKKREEIQARIRAQRSKLRRKIRRRPKTKYESGNGKPYDQSNQKH
ncbi:uncharacterized protein C18orf19 homolog A-like [Artemia franciscana]|uniref:uncharacterized protein C18orf19 homolog A-like n=1 Tax=Artemia franciscana TaxID=6661 RepID=UPI0032DB5305